MREFARLTRRDSPPAHGPIRVLMILDSFSFGGAENLVVELGRHSPANLDIAVASLAPAAQGRNALFGRLEEAGLAPTYIGVNRLRDMIGFVRMVRMLRRAPIDVVHAHLGSSAILVPFAARLAGKPVVATLHVCPQPKAPRRERIKERLSVRIPARLGRLVLVSRHAYDEFAARYGPARSTWRVVPNGVDLDRFTVRSARPSIDRPVWAAVAALRADKNHVGLIHAWEKVVAAYPGATLLIVGDGPARADIEAAVSAAGLGESVEFLGRQEDIPAILRTVDGVVSASVDEALPTALLEGAACGLPVVAADAGGTRETLVDGVTGRLVAVRDIPALAEALLEIIGDPDKAARFGAAGRAMVEEKYSLGIWVENLVDLYRDVMGGVRA